MEVVISCFWDFGFGPCGGFAVFEFWRVAGGLDSVRSAVGF